VRLVLCTSGGLYGALVLRRLLRSPRTDVAGIVLSTRVLQKSCGWWQGAYRQLALSGPPYALYLWCATGLADSLGRLTPVRPVARQAAGSGIPLLRTRDVNDARGLAFLSDTAPQLLLTAFFNQRVGETAVGVAPLGAVNIHPGALPDFRGVDPVLRALEKGATTLGVTLHRITSELDAGPVLASDHVEWQEYPSLLEATARLFCRGAELFLENIDRIAAGEPGEAQQGVGTYASWPTAAEVGAFRERGGRLVHLRDFNALRGRYPCPSER
jgi:methionyl-tRNA formyltransferase